MMKHMTLVYALMSVLIAPQLRAESMHLTVQPFQFEFEVDTFDGAFRVSDISMNLVCVGTEGIIVPMGSMHGEELPLSIERQQASEGRMRYRLSTPVAHSIQNPYRPWPRWHGRNCYSQLRVSIYDTRYSQAGENGEATYPYVTHFDYAHFADSRTHGQSLAATLGGMTLMPGYSRHDYWQRPLSCRGDECTHQLYANGVGADGVVIRRGHSQSTYLLARPGTVTPLREYPGVIDPPYAPPKQHASVLSQCKAALGLGTAPSSSTKPSMR